MTSSLRLDWVGGDAVRYSCMKWHYSRSVPVGSMATLGVWENDKFIGVVSFGPGVSLNLGKKYNLKTHQCTELLRVALGIHSNPVSKIVGVSLRLFKKQFSNMELIVSFADPEAGHHGGIYQAMNWVYTGMTSSKFEYRINGKRVQERVFNGRTFGRPAKKIPSNAIRVKVSGKHRYLYPLTKDMRILCSELSKPFPRQPVEDTPDQGAERRCESDPGAPFISTDS